MARLAVTCIQRSTAIARPLVQVFSFYEHPERLRCVTPPDLGLSLLKLPHDLRQGATFGYALTRWPWVLEWEAVVSEYRPRERFVDVQTRGPFLEWRYTHEFAAEGRQTRVSEELRYQMRGWAGPLKDALFVERALTALVEKRLELVRMLLESEPS